MTTASPAFAYNAHTQPQRFDLDQAIVHIAHWLPAQKPIKDFVHHNTLHAVQNHPFHEGIAIAAKLFGARSYLPVADYQTRYANGRISEAALAHIIAQAEADPLKRDALRLSLFQPDHNAHYPPVSLASYGIREHWLTAIEVNLNALVQPILFRLIANFLDQGISRWTVAKTGESFWHCVWRLVENSFLPLYPLGEPQVRGILNGTADAAILTCLEHIVGNEADYEQYLLEMLLAHPGWSGMVRVIEETPQALLTPRNITLKQFIAVELAIEWAFLRIKRGAAFTRVMDVPNIDKVERLTNALSVPHIPLRAKLWHEAMEYSLHAEILQALSRQPKPSEQKPLPQTQALFCLDDRECGLRRHLEEINPAIETFGAAGFFGIDFLYQGLDDAYPVAQCPVAVSPKNLVMEAHENPEQAAKKSAPNRLKHLHFGSGSMLRSWLVTQTMGLGYAARLAWDVFKPGASLLKMQQLGEVEAHTHLHLLRDHDEPTADGQLMGFSHTEMTDKIEGLLRAIGLVEQFAPLVVIVAHGSSSVNNPHFAAYDCGACAGKPGAPNARAFAWMANDATVRGLLAQRGIHIPAATRFIAALHNTSRDEITYFDTHVWEDAKPTGLETFTTAMSEALLRNAHERCRWFELGPKGNNPALSHAHVQARAASIFEPRPELNHSNNLCCVVGRRALTRPVFLDRRAFLHSYDPTTDSSGDILARILSAVIPVCGGINLEYLFSRIDNSIYGAGTKLPHNVIGLLGVANGVEGDLRTGLPAQMIEVHEPARLLMVIEQTIPIVDIALTKLGSLKEWLDNEWVKLAACHPDTREIRLYSPAGWQRFDSSRASAPPSAHLSDDIYVGKTETIPVHVLDSRFTH